MKLNKEATKYQIAKNKKSVAVICKETGLSRSAVSKAINGLTSPHFTTLGLIAEAIGVELSDILAMEK